MHTYIYIYILWRTSRAGGPGWRASPSASRAPDRKLGNNDNNDNETNSNNNNND